MEVLIDGEQFRTVEEFHQLLREKLAFPEYYGMNLDALWDCLTGYVEPPLTIKWINFQESEKRLGSNYCAKVIEIFRDAEEEVDDFQFQVD